MSHWTSILALIEKAVAVAENLREISTASNVMIYENTHPALCPQNCFVQAPLSAQHSNLTVIPLGPASQIQVPEVILYSIPSNSPTFFFLLCCMMIMITSWISTSHRPLHDLPGADPLWFLLLCSLPGSLCFSHTGIQSIHLSCLRAFVPVVTSAWNALPRDVFDGWPRFITQVSVQLSVLRESFPCHSTPSSP